jgi:hypothetical protein
MDNPHPDASDLEALIKLASKLKGNPMGVGAQYGQLSQGDRSLIAQVKDLLERKVTVEKKEKPPRVKKAGGDGNPATDPTAFIRSIEQSVAEFSARADKKGLSFNRLPVVNLFDRNDDFQNFDPNNGISLDLILAQKPKNLIQQGMEQINTAALMEWAGFIILGYGVDKAVTMTAMSRKVPTMSFKISGQQMFFFELTRLEWETVARLFDFNRFKNYRGFTTISLLQYARYAFIATLRYPGLIYAAIDPQVWSLQMHVFIDQADRDVVFAAQFQNIIVDFPGIDPRNCGIGFGALNLIELVNKEAEAFDKYEKKRKREAQSSVVPAPDDEEVEAPIEKKKGKGRGRPAGSKSKKSKINSPPESLSVSIIQDTLEADLERELKLKYSVAAVDDLSDRLKGINVSHDVANIMYDNNDSSHDESDAYDKDEQDSDDDVSD